MYTDCQYSWIIVIVVILLHCKVQDWLLSKIDFLHNGVHLISDLKCLSVVVEYFSGILWSLHCSGQYFLVDNPYM